MGKGETHPDFSKDLNMGYRHVIWLVIVVLWDLMY